MMTQKTKAEDLRVGDQIVTPGSHVPTGVVTAVWSDSEAYWGGAGVMVLTDNATGGFAYRAGVVFTIIER